MKISLRNIGNGNPVATNNALATEKAVATLVASGGQGSKELDKKTKAMLSQSTMLSQRRIKRR